MYDALAKVCSASKFGKLLCQVHGDGNITHSNTPQHSENRNNFNCFFYILQNMSAACLILKQHAGCIIPHLKDETAVKMLREIPLELDPFEIIQWMRHFFPLVTGKLPKTTPVLVEWIISKTKSYERSDNWPAIGIEFGKKMLDIIKNVKYPFA